MKYSFLILLAILISCYSEPSKQKPVIVLLNTPAKVSKFSDVADSILHAPSQINRRFSNADLNKLISIYNRGYFKLAEFDYYFASHHQSDIDIYNNDSLIVAAWDFFSDTDFEQYAITFGENSIFKEVYFFKKNILLSIHRVCNYADLDINHIVHEGHNIIIYYQYELIHATGASWIQYMFYEYENNSLSPYLTEIAHSYSFWGGPYSYEYEARIKSLSLLTFEASYQALQYDSLGDFENEHAIILQDSSEIIYVLDSLESTLIKTYSNSSFNKQKQRCFENQGAAYFIKVYQKELDSISREGDSTQRYAVNYLFQSAK